MKFNNRNLIFPDAYLVKTSKSSFLIKNKTFLKLKLLF